MKHYVCTGGCGGVSEEAGVCDSDGCSKVGRPLQPCECEDGTHEDVGGASEEKDDEDDESEDEESEDM